MFVVYNYQPNEQQTSTTATTTEDNKEKGDNNLPDNWGKFYLCTGKPSVFNHVVSDMIYSNRAVIHTPIKQSGTANIVCI